ncbi:MAG: hypothetical protein EOO99_11895 [Pedobacter sp.]|nr:MAG: hypothetical protein EOO99_11895 [Pedobacter sp.]
MRNIFFMLFLFLATSSYSQKRSDFDFIIVIDETIVTSLSNSKLLIKRDTETLSHINVSYKPGNLSLETSKYNLIANSEDDVYLKFDYYEYLGNKQKLFNYDFKIGKNWFEQPYLILRIYNTCKRKYKRKLTPIKGTNYAIDIDYGTGSTIQIRKP